MLRTLILKVTKFQLPHPKRLGTVLKNIMGAIMPPPCQIGLKIEMQMHRLFFVLTLFKSFA